MKIPREIRQRACEGLLHFAPKKTLARELGISHGSVRDWDIYVQHGFFDWVDNPSATATSPANLASDRPRFSIRSRALLVKSPRNCVPSVFGSGTLRL